MNIRPTALEKIGWVMSGIAEYQSTSKRNEHSVEDGHELIGVRIGQDATIRLAEHKFWLGGIFCGVGADEGTGPIWARRTDGRLPLPLVKPAWLRPAADPDARAAVPAGYQGCPCC